MSASASEAASAVRSLGALVARVVVRFVVERLGSAAARLA